MLTLFSTTKPFLGHSDVIQRNAIQSWLRLRPACQVLLIGPSEGTREVAAELGVEHIPQVDCNEFGTPLINSLFHKAEAAADHDLLCYINADILLLSDFTTAIGQVLAQKPRFLLAGQRLDVDIDKPWDFSRPDWEEQMRGYALEGGVLHPPTGIDYFVFRRGLFGEILPFAIGRAFWDCWLLQRARSLGVPLIDATCAITAIHQNHDYGHHAQGKRGVWKGVEAERNERLAGLPRSRLFNLEDSTHLLTPRGLRRLPLRKRLRRLIWRAVVFVLVLRPVKLLLKTILLSRNRAS